MHTPPDIPQLLFAAFFFDLCKKSDLREPIFDGSTKVAQSITTTVLFAVCQFTLFCIAACSATSAYFARRMDYLLSLTMVIAGVAVFSLVGFAMQ